MADNKADDKIDPHMFELYRHKIKTPEELRNIIGPSAA